MGSISIFDLETRDGVEDNMHTFTSDSDVTTESRSHFIPPILEFRAHEGKCSMDAHIAFQNLTTIWADAVGSIAFHPFEPCLLSASGSWHFIDEEVEKSEDDLSDLDADADSSSDGCGGSNSNSHPKGSDARRERWRHPGTLDSTLKLWNLGMRWVSVSFETFIPLLLFVFFLKFIQPAMITYGRLNIHPGCLEYY